MSAAIACPHCQQPLQIPRPAPEHVRCAQCGARIRVAPARHLKETIAPSALSTIEQPLGSVGPAAIQGSNGVLNHPNVPVATMSPAVPNSTRSSDTHAASEGDKSRKRRIGGIVLGCLLVAGICLALLWLRPDDRNVSLDIAPDQAPTKKVMDPRVKKAVDAGVAYLRQQMPTIRKARMGEVGLAGVTLLECGVPADDEQVQQLAELVRKGTPGINQTYDAAPVIFFLDRLHQGKLMPEDERKRIQTLALRLVRGQNQPINMWSYAAPVLDAKTENGLLTLLQNKAAYTTQAGGADLSNSQFAALALWSSRKSGIPVDAALKEAAATARKYQDAKTGTWGYGVSGGQYRDSGTCVGLILLALGRAVSDAKETTEFLEDPAVVKAVQHLGKLVNRHVASQEKSKAPKRGPVHADSGGDLYFLWALERTCLILGLKALGDPEQDWHRWGTDILLDHQLPSGGWLNASGPTPDTCFALLFLMQANLFQDLTDKLQFGTAFSAAPPIGPANKQ
jgi:LSD1 subclass zinc finger protein